MNHGKLRELVSGLDLQTDLWWLAMMLAGLASTFLAAFAFPDAGVFWAYLSVFLRVAMALCLAQQPWGTVFGRLLALGLATGVFEIFADYLLVNWHRVGSGQRIYPSRGLLLLESPLYAPLGWACAIVEFGYVVVRIYGLASKIVSNETGMGLTMVAGGFLAAVWTACTEFWAVKAGWWRYERGEVILGGACALYVVMAAFFIFFLFLPVFTRYLACPDTRVYAATRYGVMLAGIIFISFALSHFVVERGF